MQTFILWRTEDVSGVSGTGVVAEGIQFSDGICVCRWTTSTATTTMYDSIADVAAIHGHEGATKIIWEDDLAGPTAAHTGPYTATNMSPSNSHGPETY